MTQETPGKIFSLLGVAMASMFFLFAVTVSNASFSQVEQPLPDVFGPQHVVSLLDNVSSGYSQFLAENLFAPLHQDLAVYHDNLAWVIDNSDYAILNALGIEQLAELPAAKSQVAGAQTTVPSALYSHSGFSVDTLMSALSL